MKALIVILACGGIAAAERFWSCPKTHVTKEDREKVRGMLCELYLSKSSTDAISVGKVIVSERQKCLTN